MVFVPDASVLRPPVSDSRTSSSQPLERGVPSYDDRVSLHTYCNYVAVTAFSLMQRKVKLLLHSTYLQSRGDQGPSSNCLVRERGAQRRVQTQGSVSGMQRMCKQSLVKSPGSSRSHDDAGKRDPSKEKWLESVNGPSKHMSHVESRTDVTTATGQSSVWSSDRPRFGKLFRAQFIPHRPLPLGHSDTEAAPLSC